MSKKSKKRLVIAIVVVMILCIFAWISHTFFTENLPLDNETEVSSNQNDEPKDSSLEQPSEMLSDPVLEQAESEKETELPEPTYKQAKLAEIRQGIEVYVNVADNSYWDISIYDSVEEARKNSYPIKGTAETMFCLEGFENATQVTSKIIREDGTKTSPTYEDFYDGIYSFEEDFEARNYVIELSYVVEDIQDTVFIGVVFE